MTERQIDSLTLREKFTEAERLARELIDHLENGFCPKIQVLHRLVGDDERAIVSDDEGAPGQVSDVTVRSQAAQILASEGFTEQVYEKLKKYLVAIDGDVAKIVAEI